MLTVRTRDTGNRLASARTEEQRKTRASRMVQRNIEEAWGLLGLEAPHSPQEPWVKLTVGNELINFLIDLTLMFFTRIA